MRQSNHHLIMNSYRMDVASRIKDAYNRISEKLAVMAAELEQ